MTTNGCEPVGMEAEAEADDGSDDSLHSWLITLVLGAIGLRIQQTFSNAEEWVIKCCKSSADRAAGVGLGAVESAHGRVCEASA